METFSFRFIESQISFRELDWLANVVLESDRIMVSRSWKFPPFHGSRKLVSFVLRLSAILGVSAAFTLSLQLRTLSLRDTVLKNVTVRGSLLQYASEEFQDDPDVVFAAVAQEASAFQFASVRLKGDRKSVLKALVVSQQHIEARREEGGRQCKRASEISSIIPETPLRSASEELRNDHRFLEQVVKVNGCALNDAGKAAWSDMERSLVLLAAKSCPVILILTLFHVFRGEVRNKEEVLEFLRQLFLDGMAVNPLGVLQLFEEDDDEEESSDEKSIGEKTLDEKSLWDLMLEKVDHTKFWKTCLEKAETTECIFQYLPKACRKEKEIAKLFAEQNQASLVYCLCRNLQDYREVELVAKKIHDKCSDKISPGRSRVECQRISRDLRFFRRKMRELTFIPELVIAKTQSAEADVHETQFACIEKCAQQEKITCVNEMTWSNITRPFWKKKEEQTAKTDKSEERRQTPAEMVRYLKMLHA